MWKLVQAHGAVKQLILAHRILRTSEQVEGEVGTESWQAALDLLPTLADTC